jgi:ATP-dependent Clp protease protease subunit
MPIGVPRILYMWGEDLPAQWTDIYNFIFRRRMVFLMQYLDDELCNQVCGLLINIHMEDRTKELESKEMGASQKSMTKSENSLQKRSVDDLLNSESDLAIDENSKLEQYTLQKITLEWLNWNAQFFDYNSASGGSTKDVKSKDPYLYYLAEILAKDFEADKGNGQFLQSGQYLNSEEEMSQLMRFIRKQDKHSGSLATILPRQFSPRSSELLRGNGKSGNEFDTKSFDVYEPFRSISPQIPEVREDNHKSLNNGMQKLTHEDILSKKQMNRIYKTLQIQTAKYNLQSRFENQHHKTQVSEKAFSQRELKREYKKDRLYQNLLTSQSKFQPLRYLDVDFSAKNYAEFREYQRKQTEQLLREEESKKVFVMINSVGGSVGNGITVHDALQFIKAGSLTLALGMAASAASLALAGGTIGERYVTEGCHVMLHQPEGGVSGQASDIWIDAGEIQKIRLDVAEIYSLTTYRPRHKILKDLDRDLYLTATETVQYGLADEIATNEVMHEIIEMTNKAWDLDDSKQQRLLEVRSRNRDNTMAVEN